MTDLTTLNQKVGEMLQSETKRREVAMQWVTAVIDVLKPIAQDIWGDEQFHYGSFEPDYFVAVKKIKDGKKEDTDLLFRFKTENWNDIGFYYFKDRNQVIPLQDKKGPDFWRQIQYISDWIPQLIENIDRMNNNREKLLNNLHAFDHLIATESGDSNE